MATPPTALEDWDVDAVATWVDKVQELSELAQRFKTSKVTGKVLAKFSESQLTMFLSGDSIKAAMVFNDIQALKAPPVPPATLNLAPPVPPATLNLGLALPDNFFNERRTTIDDEGLKATPWPLRRDDLCRELERIVDDYELSRHHLLVRGPFASGKTALAQLLHYHLRQKHTVYIVTVAGCARSWPEYWFQQTQVAWDTVVDSTTPIYVIIDEVQASYSETSSAHSLWGSVKRVDNVKNMAVRFIFFGSYGDPQPGESTPIYIPPAAIISLHPHNGTPGLAYTIIEFRALGTSFQNYSRIPIDERSINYIFHMTDGHPGIGGLILRCVYEHRKEFSLDVETAKDDVYKYLHSAGLHDVLQNASTRGIPNFDKYPTISNVCKRVLSADSFKLPFAEIEKNSSEMVELEGCLKASLLGNEGNFIMFSCPIVQNRALAHYFSQTSKKPASLHAFIIEVVQRFSTRQLCNTESRDTKSRIMEGQWQQEFFRAAATLLPADVVISPEYGREQGVQAQVDFYIAKYQWMVEVLREGLAMAAHERRFEPGGHYAPLLGSIQEWAVVDFRGTQKEVRRAPHNNTFHLTFNEDFTKFTVRDPSGQEQQFPLQGDQVLATRTDRVPGNIRS